MRQILPRLGQIGASLAAVAPGGDVRDRLVSFLNDYDRSVGEESDETVVAQALRRIKSEQISEKTTATVGQIAIVACEISKSLGKGELSAKAVGSILRGTFGLKPRRSKGGWNVEIPDLADERLAVAGERGERCSGVSR
jgi:hypothetical protein